MRKAISFKCKLWEVPMLFMAAMAVVLSINIWMCLLLTVLNSASRANKAALSSRILQWSSDSSADHKPLYVELSYDTPHPLMEESVRSLISTAGGSMCFEM